LWSKTLVAQCEIGDRVAEELLAQVLFVLFDIVGEIALNGGSGAGGKMKPSDKSDHTGDMLAGCEVKDVVRTLGNGGRDGGRGGGRDGGRGGGRQASRRLVSRFEQALLVRSQEELLNDIPANASSMGSCRCKSIDMRCRFWTIAFVSTYSLSGLEFNIRLPTDTKTKCMTYPLNDCKMLWIKIE